MNDDFKKAMKVIYDHNIRTHAKSDDERKYRENLAWTAMHFMIATGIIKAISRTNPAFASEIAEELAGLDPSDWNEEFARGLEMAQEWVRNNFTIDPPGE